MGAHILATGRYGHGPHHTEFVFYVGPNSFELIPEVEEAPTDAHNLRQSVGVIVGISTAT